jgi:hypothetical protein
LRAGRRVTRWLGEVIGVPVEPEELRDRLDHAAAAGHPGKPAGAGGELAVCLPPIGAAVPAWPWARPVSVSPAGVSDAGVSDAGVSDAGVSDAGVGAP